LKPVSSILASLIAEKTITEKTITKKTMMTSIRVQCAFGNVEKIAPWNQC